MVNVPDVPTRDACTSEAVRRAEAGRRLVQCQFRSINVRSFHNLANYSTRILSLLMDGHGAYISKIVNVCRERCISMSVFAHPAPILHGPIVY